MLHLTDKKIISAKLYKIYLIISLLSIVSIVKLDLECFFFSEILNMC